MTPRVLVAISSHGLGHLGQTAPVLQALAEARPHLHYTLLTAIDGATLRGFLPMEHAHVSPPADAAVVMNGPLEVDIRATLEAFSRWHADYDVHRRDYIALLREQRPDLVITNIDYTVIDAAKSLGLPVIALCSLNWADILAPYLPGGENHAIYRDILASYNRADLYLSPLPHLDMSGLRNRCSVGAVARLGRQRRAELCDRLSLEPDTGLVLFSLGGIAMSGPPRAWLVPDNTHWLIPQALYFPGESFTVLESVDMPFIDVLASCDVMVAKPGYGSFVEAAFNRTQVIYLPRPNWREAPVLVDWLRALGIGAAMTPLEFRRGNFEPVFSRLPSVAWNRVSLDSGVDDAVRHILQMLDAR